MRILIAEDEKRLCDVISKRLKAEGYAVDSAYDGDEALTYLEGAMYDLVILDVMMPKRDGFSVISTYRSGGGNAPVLFLTARDSLEDRIHGLDSGGDDYMTKPFESAELLARVRALLRRSSTAARSDVLALSDLVLDRTRHEVRRGKEVIDLSQREFSILEYMLLNEGVVLSREAILSHSWDFGFEGESNVVDVYIRYLRKKIDDPYDVKLIHTVRGSGYVMKKEKP